MKKILVLCAILLMAASISFLYFRSSPTSGTEHFTLAVNTWVGYGPLWLAQEKGFFEQEGVKVAIVTMEDVGQRKVALIKGDVDGVGDTVDSLVLARDEKVPAVAVMQFDESKGADGIVVVGNIHSVSDLKGKQVAVQKNFVSEAFLDYVLQKNGMTPKDVRMIDMEAGAAGAAFVSGRVDAAVTYEPWLSKARERDSGHILVSSADERGVVVDVLSVGEPYLANHPAAIQKVMRAWFRALQYWKDHRQEANAIMAAHYNLAPSDFGDLISGVAWPTYEEDIAYFGTPARPGRIYQVAHVFSDIFLKTGQITKRPDMRKAINGTDLQTLYEKK